METDGPLLLALASAMMRVTASLGNRDNHSNLKSARLYFFLKASKRASRVLASLGFEAYTRKVSPRAASFLAASSKF